MYYKVENINTYCFKVCINSGAESIYFIQPFQPTVLTRQDWYLKWVPFSGALITSRHHWISGSLVKEGSWPSDMAGLRLHCSETQSQLVTHLNLHRVREESKRRKESSAGSCTTRALISCSHSGGCWRLFILTHRSACKTQQSGRWRERGGMDSRADTPPTEVVVNAGGF